MATFRGSNTNNDLLFGTNLDDTIIGLGGDDELHGGDGNDNISGGAGNDTLYGEDGDDLLNAGAGDDFAYGGIGKDLLNGAAGNDHLEGGDNNDIMNGGTGADTMIGGDGNDSYFVDDAGDVVLELTGEGRDIVYSTISYTLTGDVESLKLNGTANLNGTGNGLDNNISGNDGNNVLSGLDGDDSLFGGLGADVMIGGNGNDNFFVDNAGDIVAENSGEGTDTVNSTITYTLGLDVENLTLSGTNAINGTGNGAANVITGNSNSNTLTGGGGDDTLTAGLGNDLLFGGNGADHLIFTDAPGTGGLDTVNNFDHGVDDLEFIGANFGFSAGHSLGAGEFTAGASAVGVLAQFIYDAAADTLFFDADGAGAGAQVAVVAFIGSEAGVTASDILFI